MAAKSRLDAELVRRGLARSREHAQALVSAGRVRVGGLVATKPATGVDAAVDPKQTKITLTGIDRQKVGQVAAEMRSLRPPDPYKNKGVRYAGERLKKKVGKTGAK